MEISLLQLIMAILTMASGFDNADQDFADYIGLYQGEGWSDPYTPQNVCNITGPETDINVTLNSTPTNQTISNETLTNSTDVNVTLINDTDATNTTIPENPEDPEINHTFIIEDGSVIIYADVQIYSPDTIYKFNRFVNWSNPLNPIFGFGLGDQIDDENKLWQLDDFKAIDAQITYPHEYVKGNHEGTKVTLWNHNDKRLIQIGNTCFALMNSYNGEAHGAWRTDQVVWLDASMMQSAGLCDHFIVLSHHAIYDPKFASRPLADDMKAALESHSGHYTTVRHYKGHNDWYTVNTDNGIDYVTVPGVRQLTDRDNPSGIVFDTATAESQLCWTGKPCQTIYR